MARCRSAPPSATVGYLPQEPERRTGETVRTFLARRTGVTAAQAELHRATAALAEAEPDCDRRYDMALTRWLALGGADLDARIGPVWADLDQPERLLDQDMTTLSGGQAARASLAAILLAQFDVFLLDEPTNDLDFAGLDRLEQFLDGLPGGAVVVSHDRAFLDRTITSRARARRAHAIGPPLRRRLVGIPRRTRHGTEACGGGVRDLRREAANRSRQRAREQRQWAVQGARNLTSGRRTTTRRSETSS